jgi:hypothetical protein
VAVAVAVNDQQKEEEEELEEEEEEQVVGLVHPRGLQEVKDVQQQKQGLFTA